MICLRNYFFYNQQLRKLKNLLKYLKKMKIVIKRIEITYLLCIVDYYVVIITIQKKKSKLKQIENYLQFNML